VIYVRRLEDLGRTKPCIQVLNLLRVPTPSLSENIRPLLIKLGLENCAADVTSGDALDGEGAPELGLPLLSLGLTAVYHPAEMPTKHPLYRQGARFLDLLILNVAEVADTPARQLATEDSLDVDGGKISLLLSHSHFLLAQRLDCEVSASSALDKYNAQQFQKYSPSCPNLAPETATVLPLHDQSGSPPPSLMVALSVNSGSTLGHTLPHHALNARGSSIPNLLIPHEALLRRTSPP
jgi:hypothetical protein